MRKESVQKFDLEAAFKALDTVEIPTVKGIRPNREDLQEKFTRKLVTDILVEDYYDVGDTGELEQAQEEREAEVAKAKLARIEKIVDLDAETEDDILPSYVGKFIMQCPQCMTLFYKNEEDIERSEEAPDVVNINEPCQHCGNSSGYTLVGKVDTVGEEEAAQYDVDDFEENELDLNFDDEEASAEEPAEAEEEVATEGEAEEDADLDLDLAPVEDEEEEVQESLSLREEHEAASLNLEPAIANRFTKAQLDSLTPEEIKILQNPRDREGREKIIAKYNPKHPLDEATINISKAEMEKLDKEVEEATKEVAKYKIPMKAQKNSVGQTENVPDFEAVPEAQREAAKKAYDRYSKAIAARPDRAKNIINYTDESLTEDIDKDLDAKLKAHNDYIDYLKKMIEQEEEALDKADNEYVKKAIQRRLDAFKADLEEALPDALKDEAISADELPTPEEVDMEAAAENKEEPKEKKESLSEALADQDEDIVWREIDDLFAVMNGDLQVFVGTKEECENWLEARRSPSTTVPGRFKIVKCAEVPVVKEALNLDPSIAARFTKSQLDNLTPEEIKILQNPRDREAINKIIAKYNSEEKKESLSEDAVTTKKVDSLFAVLLNGRQVCSGTKAECENFVKAQQKNAAAKYQKFEIVQGADVPVLSKDESLTEATATISRLKRNYSATEIMVKELKTIEPFNKLSTRTIQRVLLPYYIENMGREDLSTQALVNFFEYEGFASYVLDHFMSMDPLARKELLKADEKFMQIFNDYASAYNFFPGKDEILEPGESEFDYAFNIMFDIDVDGLARDTELTRNTIKSLGRMYVEGRFDKSLIVEELTEDAAVDVLFDSEEFQTPVTDAEINEIRAQYEGLEEDVAPGMATELAIQDIVDTWESVEDFDDESFNKLTENYLTNVYSNVKSFEATACDLNDNKLIVEGMITFNSGKTKSTTFEYEARATADKKLVLEGVNADFSSEKAFTLNCKVDTENRLIVKSLNYKYTINDTPVEGLLK